LLKNLQLKHDDVNDKAISPPLKQKVQMQNSNEDELKIGRNDKIKVISPSGNEEEIKFKKLESYLSKGYTRG
jgi:preprotein translocase subunit SecA